MPQQSFSAIRQLERAEVPWVGAGSRLRYPNEELYAPSDDVPCSPRPFGGDEDSLAYITCDKGGGDLEEFVRMVVRASGAAARGQGKAFQLLPCGAGWADVDAPLGVEVMSEEGSGGAFNFWRRGPNGFAADP